MGWEDIIIATASVVFIFSLIEQAHENFKSKSSTISFITSFLYSAGLFAMSIAMISLDLFFSAFVTLINALMWLLLFIQTYIYE